MKNVARPPDLTFLTGTEIRLGLIEGTLVKCGSGVRPLCWPESSIVRAYALNKNFLRGYSFVLRSAAWIWGVNEAESETVEISTLGPARSADVAPGHKCYEFSLGRQDILNFGHVMVTTPSRTVYDLLFLTEHEYLKYGAQCVYKLVKKFELVENDLFKVVSEKSRPHSIRAKNRLADAYQRLSPTR